MTKEKVLELDIPELNEAFKTIAETKEVLDGFIAGNKANPDVSKEVALLSENVNKIALALQGLKLSGIFSKEAKDIVDAVKALGTDIKKIKMPDVKFPDINIPEQPPIDLSGLNAMAEALKNRSFTIANFDEMPMQLGLATEKTLQEVKEAVEKASSVEYVWTDGNLTQKIETFIDRTVTTVYTWSGGNVINKEITIT